jgi:prepilin peptidase CpaA
MNTFLITLLVGSIGISLIEDLRRQKIPNAVTYPTMAMAVGCHSLSGGLEGLCFSAGGLGLAIALFIIPYLHGGMGAGDVKLMGAAGAIFGPKGICIVCILAVLSGGVYGMILFAMNQKYTASLLRRLWATLRTFVLTQQLILFPRDAEESHPVLRYAVPIALGALGYLFMNITGHDPFLELLAGKLQALDIAMY